MLSSLLLKYRLVVTGQNVILMHCTKDSEIGSFRKLALLGVTQETCIFVWKAGENGSQKALIK
jgi:hypothetical protein